VDVLLVRRDGTMPTPRGASQLACYLINLGGLDSTETTDDHLYPALTVLVATYTNAASWWKRASERGAPHVVRI
jgi:hypothetical protein